MVRRAGQIDVADVESGVGGGFALWPVICVLCFVGCVTPTSTVLFAHANERRGSPVVVPCVVRHKDVVISAPVSVARAVGAELCAHGLEKTGARRTLGPQFFIGVGVFGKTVRTTEPSCATEFRECAFASGGVRGGAVAVDDFAE